MKVLKVVLFILILMALAFVIIAYSGPQKLEISSQKIINAPDDVVYRYASRFEYYDQWNPWLRSENHPGSVQTELPDTDGEEGAQLRWKNTNTHEKGIHTIRSLTKGKHIDIDLTMEGEPSAQYSLVLQAENDSTTRVELNYITEFSGLAPRFFATLQGGQQKNDLEKKFEKGLVELKSLAEDYQNIRFGGYSMKRKNYPGGLFLAKRDTISHSQITSFLGKNFYSEMYQIQEQNVKTVGMPTGIYYDFLPDGKIDMAAGIGIQGDINAAPGYEITGIPKGQALELLYYGDYESINKAHNALEEYLQYFDLTKTDPVLEEYITDPSLEPDTSKWETRITYFIKDGI